MWPQFWLCALWAVSAAVLGEGGALCAGKHIISDSVLKQNALEKVDLYDPTTVCGMIR